MSVQVRRETTATVTGPLTLGELRAVLAQESVEALGDDWLVEVSSFGRESVFRLLEPVEIVVAPQSELDPSVSIDDLDLATRSYNILRREGVVTVADLLSRSANDLLELRNCRRDDVEEVRRKLAVHGWTLAGELPA